ncbi:MAG: twin-arginine translocase TatA/TatE family subunit [Sphingobacteriaceae bacterium]
MQMNILLFLNVGTPELLLILLAALLLFGGNKLPELARGLGKGIREFKDASENVKREIHRNINEVQQNLEESTSVDTSAKEKDQESLKS